MNGVAVAVPVEGRWERGKNTPSHPTMSSPPEKFAMSPKNGDHGSRHRPRQPIQPPPASAVSTASARSHHPPRIAPWGLGKNSPFHMATPHLGSRAKTYPNQLPTQAVPNRRHPSPAEDRRAPGSPPRIAPGRAGLWRPDCGSSPAPASPGPLMRMSASSSPPTSFSSSSSSFCVIKAIFCDGFQTFCTPFFFALYICTLHVTGVGDEMRRRSSIHAWAVEGEGSIASWHH